MISLHSNLSLHQSAGQKAGRREEKETDWPKRMRDHRPPSSLVHSLPKPMLSVPWNHPSLEGDGTCQPPGMWLRNRGWGRRRRERQPGWGGCRHVPGEHGGKPRCQAHINTASRGWALLARKSEFSWSNIPLYWSSQILHAGIAEHRCIFTTDR